MDHPGGRGGGPIAGYVQPPGSLDQGGRGDAPPNQMLLPLLLLNFQGETRAQDSLLSY